MASASHKLCVTVGEGGNFAVRIDGQVAGCLCSPLVRSTRTKSTGELRYRATAQAFRGLSVSKVVEFHCRLPSFRHFVRQNGVIQPDAGAARLGSGIGNATDIGDVEDRHHQAWRRL